MDITHAVLSWKSMPYKSIKIELSYGWYSFQCTEWKATSVTVVLSFRAIFMFLWIKLSFIQNTWLEKFVFYLQCVKNLCVFMSFNLAGFHWPLLQGFWLACCSMLYESIEHQQPKKWEVGRNTRLCSVFLLSLLMFSSPFSIWENYSNFPKLVSKAFTWIHSYYYWKYCLYNEAVKSHQAPQHWLHTPTFMVDNTIM